MIHRAIPIVLAGLALLAILTDTESGVRARARSASVDAAAEVRSVPAEAANRMKQVRGAAGHAIVLARQAVSRTVQARAAGSKLPAHKGQSVSGLSANDIRLMANAVYGEARGESFIGQVAVAAVILNRVKSPSFPNTVSGVIFQPGAFTAVSDGQIWQTPNAEAKRAVMDALQGYDPTNGCIYYYNPKTATNQWIRSRPVAKHIGHHIFCH